MVAKFSSLLVVATLAISSVFAQAPTTNLINGACVSNYDASIDYFPEKIDAANSAAKYFSVEYFNNYKVVKDLYSKSTYVLYQCGTPAPTGISNVNATFQIPISTAAVMETTAVPFIEMLNQGKSISVVSDGDLICSPCFQKYLNSGAITQLSTTNKTLQSEQLSNVQVQFGKDSYDLNKNTSTNVMISQTYEPTILGRSSWLLFYSTFYNTEKTANAVYSKLFDNYNNLVAAADSYSPKPVVAWTVYDAPSSYNNNTASYLISTSDFKMDLTKKAGGVPVVTDKTTFATSSELLAAIKDVDVLIDETYIGNNLTNFLKSYNISTEQQKGLKFLANKQVYRVDGTLTASNGFDWFEAPVAMADALLEDMINAINPTALYNIYSRNWLRNIVNNEPIVISTEANCTWGLNEPRPSDAVDYAGGEFSLKSSTAKDASAAQRTVVGTVGALVASLVTLAYLS